MRPRLRSRSGGRDPGGRRGRKGKRWTTFRALDQVLYDDFAALRANEDRQLVELVDGLSAPQLAAPVRYRRIIGEGLEEVRAGHVLLTLFNHQTHHRGQVHVLLTQADVTPPPLDVVFFLEEIGEAGPPGTLAPAGS